jgi:hypothetical protein
MYKYNPLTLTDHMDTQYLRGGSIEIPYKNSYDKNLDTDIDIPNVLPGRYLQG